MESETSVDKPYNPYEFRTEGRLTTALAFIHLIKCSIGSGVLTFPFGFKCSGMVGGLIVGVCVSAFVVFTFLILINTMVKVAALQKKPYITLKEAVVYVMDTSYPSCKSISNVCGLTIDAMMVINYVGTCALYYNYVIIATLTISGYPQYAEGAINKYRAIVCAIWFLPLFAINCCRNLKALAPASLAGNILIISSLCLTVFIILTPDEKGFSTNWHYFGDLSTIPLFMGAIMFAVGSFGLGLAIERDMIKSEKFVGVFGTYNTAMVVVVILYLCIGVLGYWKYGNDVKSTIVLTIPSDNWLAIVLQSLVGLALYCSYPLMFHVVVDIVWHSYISRSCPKNPILMEYVFRFVGTGTTGLIALYVPRFDIILGLIGALTVGFLGLFLPALLEFNYWQIVAKCQKKGVLFKDVIIMCFGTLCIVAGVYAAADSTIAKLNEPEST